MRALSKEDKRRQSNREAQRAFRGRQREARRKQSEDNKALRMRLEAAERELARLQSYDTPNTSSSLVLPSIETVQQSLKIQPDDKREPSTTSSTYYQDKTSLTESPSRDSSIDLTSSTLELPSTSVWDITDLSLFPESTFSTCADQLECQDSIEMPDVLLNYSASSECESIPGVGDAGPEAVNNLAEDETTLAVTGLEYLTEPYTIPPSNPVPLNYALGQALRALQNSETHAVNTARWCEEAAQLAKQQANAWYQCLNLSDTFNGWHPQQMAFARQTSHQALDAPPDVDGNLWADQVLGSL